MGTQISRNSSRRLPTCARFPSAPLFASPGHRLFIIKPYFSPLMEIIPLPDAETRSIIEINLRGEAQLDVDTRARLSSGFSPRGLNET